MGTISNNGSMNSKPGPLESSWLLTPKVHGDSRGQFVESFQKDVFAEQTGLSIDFIQDKFPNVEIIHEQYKFDSLDPIVLEAATKEWESIEDKSVLPTAQGYSKAYAAKDLKSELRKKYDIKLSIHGITANPPIDVQKELGFDKVAEPRRNKTYDEETWKKSGKMHYRPFVNVDKKFVADLYKQFDLMDDLFPITMSCIGFEKETNYFTEPCKKCYWCHEKKWAFGCYDGGAVDD